jgi:hypothetical protein
VTFRQKIAALFAVTYCFLVVGVAQGGTIITTNLPAGTTIVNVDATTDGCITYDGSHPSQPYWFGPSAGSPSLTVLPGTYTFRVIDPNDASAAYPALTSGQLSQIYTAWTYNSPWIENYMVFNNTAVANISEYQIFDGADTPPGLTNTSSPSAAYSSVGAAGYLDKIRPAPPGRAGQSPSDFVSSWTFAVPTTLRFVIPDNVLSDNGGGVSVVVTQVPEPSTAVLALVSCVGAMALIRKKR